MASPSILSRQSICITSPHESMEVKGNLTYFSIFISINKIPKCSIPDEPFLTLTKEIESVEILHYSPLLEYLSTSPPVIKYRSRSAGCV